MAGPSRTVLSVLPLAAAGVSFSAWILLAQVADDFEIARAVKIVAVGTVLYLPCTLGLPIAYARLSREGDPSRHAKQHFVRCSIVIIAISLTVVSAITTFFLPAALFGPTLAVMGLGVTSAQLLAESRVLTDLIRGVLAASFGPAVPLAAVVAASQGWLATSFFLVCAIQALTLTGCWSIWRLQRSGDAPNTILLDFHRESVVKYALALSVPLIPHVLAVAILAQAPRFYSSVTDSAAETLVAINTVVLIASISHSLLNGFHGLWSADLLRQELSRSAVQRSLRQYVVIGGALAPLTAVALRLVDSVDLLGPARIDNGTILATASLPISMSMYFLASTLIFYAHSPILLAALSVSGAGVFGVCFAVTSPSVPALFTLQAMIVASLAAATWLIVRMCLDNTIVPSVARLVATCVLGYGIGLGLVTAVLEIGGA